ncbi:MAG: preprotein translocase subunit YajC [Clostridium sp.]|nr:preprotein translocase subunit YajC [Clostridium sp.]MCM1546937.1 preprotein translocase subunit YajC [Ruminococcus sp.]
MNNLFIVLSANTNQSAGSSMLTTFLLFAIVIVFFYFLMIRPQKKKDKEQQEMRETIQIGDEIMTIGGIVGIVVKKTEDTVVIETGGDKSKLRIKMWAIQENVTVSEKLTAEKNEKKKAMMEAAQNKKKKKQEKQ